jgi:hypothetical protein
MNAMKATTFAFAAALLALNGCSTYRVMAFKDHPQGAATRFETMKTTSYVGLYSTAEHIFWMCKDKEDVLECERRCGSGTDLECPSASASAMGGISTNVR